MLSVSWGKGAELCSTHVCVCVCVCALFLKAGMQFRDENLFGLQSQNAQSHHGA